MTSGLGESVIPLSGMRLTIARRMVAAWQAPVFHLSVTVEITDAEARRRGVEGASLTDELIRCVALALRAHPDLNAYFKDDTIRLQPSINIGLAVALDDGLIVPVLHDVGVARLQMIANSRRDVVNRARSGDLTSADVAGGTFTVSNLGMYGVDHFDALLNLPQVAILAVGAAQPRLVLNGSMVEEREFVEFTLTVDHRAVNGAEAGAFMATLKSALESGVLPSADGH